MPSAPNVSRARDEMASDTTTARAWERPSRRRSGPGTLIPDTSETASASTPIPSAMAMRTQSFTEVVNPNITRIATVVTIPTARSGGKPGRAATDDGARSRKPRRSA